MTDVLAGPWAFSQQVFAKKKAPTQAPGTLFKIQGKLCFALFCFVLLCFALFCFVLPVLRTPAVAVSAEKGRNQQPVLLNTTSSTKTLVESVDSARCIKNLLLAGIKRMAL